ncbi:MAG: DNA repair protein RecO [Cytophagales bacterium]|nr:DNA repair protein RecO [Cytophagales bacterium]
MIVKTRGIVLNHIDYRESSIIVKIYTENYGYQGFVVNSVRSAKSRQGMAYFQPFTVLDMVLYMKSSRDLNRISEFKPLLHWYAEDIKRQSILLFLAEVANKLLRNEHSENKELFNYLLVGLQNFKSSRSVDNFHLIFLLQMTPLLGITVLSGEELFENMNKVADQLDINGLVDQLLYSPFDNQVETTGDLRYRVLEMLINYFQHHIPGFGEVHSLKVLQQIFR